MRKRNNHSLIAPDFNTSSSFLVSNKDFSAGKVMNVKVKIEKSTKPNDVRYCESVTAANYFLLKYFVFECSLCQRFTSHIWTSNCGSCAKQFETQKTCKGICLNCCT